MGLGNRLFALTGVGAFTMYAGFRFGIFEADPSDTAVSEVGPRPDEESERIRLSVEDIASLRGSTSREKERPLSALNAETAGEQVAGLQRLQAAAAAVLSRTLDSLKDSSHPRTKKALRLLEQSLATIHGSLQGVIPVTAGRLSPAGISKRPPASWAKLPGGKPMVFSVTVAERPFGMHVGKGTAVVQEVFPGFPAAKAGVRVGCEVVEIAEHKVAPGTWLETFQQTPLPFVLRLQCKPATSGPPALDGKGPLSENAGRYRVMVVKKPFGMNVQTNVVPRVVDVLPGYPAEAAGVRRGFVVIAVNDLAVDSSTWFKAYNEAPVPFTLTFETKAPLHAGNAFFPTADPTTDGAPPEATQSSSKRPVKDEPEGNPMDQQLFEDFQCSVDRLPFGMQVMGIPGRWPRVVKVLEGFPADKHVKEGDILIEVAGRQVTAGTWFPAMQQAVTPYGLKFRRPKFSAGGSVPRSSRSPKMSHSSGPSTEQKDEEPDDDDNDQEKDDQEIAKILQGKDEEPDDDQEIAKNAA